MCSALLGLLISASTLRGLPPVQSNLETVAAATHQMLDGRRFRGEDGVFQEFGFLTAYGDSYTMEIRVTLADGSVHQVKDLLSEVNGQTQVVESVDGVDNGVYLASITPSHNLKITPVEVPQFGFISRVCRYREDGVKCQKNVKLQNGKTVTTNYFEVAEGN